MPDPTQWPSIALVTPVFNSAHYLEATIQSVLSQLYPNLQYVIADGGSTDGTLEIIRKYQHQLHAWFSEPDHGMYDALNKGFARTSADIMGWINASDLLHVRSLFTVGSIFQQFPQVDWITGRPTILNAEGQAVAVLSLKRWSRFRFLAGANRYIQQESTMWRRRLWERAGGNLDTSWGPAGDFELWVRFFRHARLHSLDALVGAYRLHKDSLSARDLAASDRAHDRIVEGELASLPGTTMLSWFRSVGRSVQGFPALEKPWRKLILGTLMKWPGSDLSPIIRYRKGNWQMDAR
jgi:glycosyltransferase involved in cell wall biosynthesis